MSPPYHLLSNELLDEIAALDRDHQAEWLFLTPSDQFKGRWHVDSLLPDFFFDFEDIVGHYRTISPARLPELLDRAEDLEYKVVFDEPPEDILEAYEHLQDPPPFSLNSSLEETIGGMLPWQLQGFNKLVRDESLNAGLVIWDTGTGKTAFVASALRWHQEFGHPYDLALVVVKKNNKTDMQRKIKRLADLDAYVIEGTPKRRFGIYERIEADLLEGKKVIAITNYEKLREDPDFFWVITENRDVLFFWDEMPVKLSNRSTTLYEAVQKVIWDKFWTKKGGLGAVPRPKWMRHWELTATPIENSPDGIFSCIRLMTPPLLGKVEEFESAHVGYRNPISRKPEKWKNLDKLEGKIEFMTHRVSREDPEVARMFPNVMEDPIVIDWNPASRKIYDMLTDKAAKLLEDDTDFAENNVLAIIQVMQMVCDAPSMIARSAENRKEFNKLIEDLGEDDLVGLDGPRGSEIALILLNALRSPPTDEGHSKFEALREILTEKHPDEKVLVYMTWASYGFDPLTKKLEEWRIPYVTYTGTDRQRLEAKDRFRSDPNIRIFLSSDKGSDSIDLPEAAVGVNYNLPWTWTRKRQRQGRNDRVDSQLETTWWYDLIMANSIEERKREIIETKHGYHRALFDGAAIEDTLSGKLSREDLIYILLGD